VRFSDFTITTSPLREKKLRERTQKRDVAVIMNLPRMGLFKFKDMTDFIKDKNLEKSFIVSFIGGLNPERELDIVIRAIKHVEISIPNIALIICGTGEREYIESLHQLIVDLNLENKVIYMGYVPQNDVLNYVAISNVSLNPYKSHPNQDPVSSTKIFEYLMVSKPVIVPDYPANRKEFQDMVLFYESSDHVSLGDKIFEVYSKEQKYIDVAKNAKDILFNRYDPQKNEKKLIEVYAKLLNKRANKK
jgi:glycosyltransferase involved in cell wall biosynthesis